MPNRKRTTQQSVWPARLSQPAVTALEAAGITCLEDLAQRTERDIANLHGMGPKGIRILKEELAARSLSFTPESTPKNGKNTHERSI